MIELKGNIIFDPPDLTNKHLNQNSWKKVVIVDIPDDTCKYYAWFLLKRFNLKLNPPIRGSHITIINDRKNEINIARYEILKKQLNGKEISFKFDPEEIRTNGKHWWIRINDSLDAENIRQLVGLNRIPNFPYHLTIGYANEKNIEHSEYILSILKYFKFTI